MKIELAGEDCGWVSDNPTGSVDANGEFQYHNDASQCSQKALFRSFLELQVRDVGRKVFAEASFFYYAGERNDGGKTGV